MNFEVIFRHKKLNREILLHFFVKITDGEICLLRYLSQIVLFQKLINDNDTIASTYF